MKTVYCDEAGFTGSNLLNVDQPYFTMASVYLAPEEADELLGELRQRARVQSPEVKGARIVRSRNGQRAVDWLVSELGDSASVVLAHKRYSLCCKFFEFMIEPIIQSGSLLFYRADFHRFVATGLFVEALVQKGVAEELLHLFESTARNRPEATVAQVLDCLRSSAAGEKFVSSVANICAGYSDVIEQELAAESEGGAAGTWSLDLSTTCLVAMLSHWSVAHGKLQVVCDDSRPVAAYREVLDAMTEADDIPFVRFAGEEAPIGWLLSEPIRLADSRTEAGLQLADVLASAVAYHARWHQSEAASTAWLNEHIGMLHPSSILPDLSHFDLSRTEVVVNAVVLSALEERAASGEDPVEGMGVLMAVTRETLAREGPPWPDES